MPLSTSDINADAFVLSLRYVLLSYTLTALVLFPTGWALLGICLSV